MSLLRRWVVEQVMRVAETLSDLFQVDVAKAELKLQGRIANDVFDSGV